MSEPPNPTQSTSDREDYAATSALPSPISSGVETDGTEGCSVTVMPTSNVGGIRKWDKKHYCLYCDVAFAKLPRHLYSCHKEEREVVEIASETTLSVRKKLLLKIRNLGNHAHNCQVLREGHGVLIVAYRPNQKVSPDAYGPCIHCFAYHVRTDLWRHQCPLKPARPQQTDGAGRMLRRVSGRVASASDLLKPPPSGITFQLNQVLSAMKRDEVSLVVRNDTLIVGLAKREYAKLGHDVDQHGYIRNRIRELGRLVIQLRKNTHQPNASLESFVHPHHFADVVKAVHDIAGLSEDDHLYDVPSLALKLGYSMKKCALLLKGFALECGQRCKAERADEFVQLCELNWRDRVSTHAHRTLRQEKRNNPTVLPSSSDVVKMSSFLHEAGTRELQLLQGNSDQELRPTWQKLNEVTLCHLIMFNRRRQGEVSKMTVQDFHKRSTASVEQGDCVLTDIERHLCKMFRVVEIVGKRGRTVPVLLSNEAEAWLNALISTRAQAGVAPDNKYLFARCSYGGNGHLRGCDCLRAYANKAGLDNASSIRSTRLRKHVATACQMLALKENQLDSLAKFMGHDLRVHREYYQLPDTVQRITRLSRLFLSLERGNLQSQQGKSLDQVHVTGGEYATRFQLLQIKFVTVNLNPVIVLLAEIAIPHSGAPPPKKHDQETNT